MAHSIKKPWTRPEVKRFGTSEELLAYFSLRGSAAEREKLEELVKQAPTKSPQGKLRRRANG